MIFWWAIIRGIGSLWRNRRERWAQAIMFALTVIAVGVYLAFDVTFMEKHFPKANAAVHSGEVSTESDAEYRMTKMVQDIEAIEADFKNDKEWTPFRTESMSRMAYVNDLKDHNKIFQRRLSIEKSANLGANDVCEALALDETGPALDSYVRAVDGLFQEIRNTPVMTQKAKANIDRLSSTEETTGKALSTAFADTKTKGCDK
jgi:hypothetical protein